MLGSVDRWLGLAEISNMFGLSEESIKRLAKSQGFPLRRLTPYAMPGVIESELMKWLKAQPRNGKPVRRRAPKPSAK
jgi:predicted DNA-binding transcriptional regulator AlpA